MPDTPSRPSDQCDLAIIGAGAAGLMAAIFAGRNAPPGTKIVLLDGAKKVGAKILIAGGGRCNVTHDVVTTADYFGGASGNTVKKILKSFGVNQTTAFFNDLGVELKREDTGKLFPTTDKARTVLDALLHAVHDAGVELRTGSRVLIVQRDESRRFVIDIDHAHPLTARRVVLATGGQALPDTGSDGFGYVLARRLGHTVTDTWPALVPLNLPPDHWLTELSGVTLDVELTLSGKTGKTLYKQAGPMLLAHFGVTGPAAMDMSRHLRDYGDQAPRKLTANLCPGLTFEQLDASILDWTRQYPTRSIGALMKKRLPDRFAEAMLTKYLGIETGLPLSRLSREDRKALCHAMTALPLPVVGDRGFKHAEVTAGGVPMSEVRTATMASNVCDGLYLCGEILDVDGRIGGYNFQWAWCTGRLAGLAAIDSLNAPRP
ncbi:MAG: NAD(P)/FAD-dependent oxidoreductase [Phycisphaeraceae bacterium]